MHRFDSRRAKEILRIPDRYGIPLMVATGYDYGSPPVIHADVPHSDDRWGDNGELNTQHSFQTSKKSQQRTPRLEMNELFFGDTFGEPLDLLLDCEGST